MLFVKKKIYYIAAIQSMSYKYGKLKKKIKTQLCFFLLQARLHSAFSKSLNHRCSEVAKILDETSNKVSAFLVQLNTLYFLFWRW